MILMIWYFTSLQVSDVEQIMGLVQAENIQVHAESYDVALDMSFPKGFWPSYLIFLCFVILFLN